MKHYIPLAALILLTACASTYQEERINAVKDFIEVNDLEETRAIRTFEQLNQNVLNDKYVIVSTRRDQYLLEYTAACREDPMRQRPRPDVRRDAGAIYADSDTFRGCQIGALYPISKDQAEELKRLGRAPGE